MNNTHQKTSWSIGMLIVSLLCAPSARATNWVVDGLNGDDTNAGMSATGGPSDASCSDFGDPYHRFCLDFGPATALATIGEATSRSVPGDYIFVNTGRYSETVRPSSSTTIVAVGDVVVADGGFYVRGSYATNVTIDGFTIENTAYGVWAYTNTQLRNCTIRSCQYGIYYSGFSTIRRCIVTDCSSVGISGHPAMGATIENCTVVANARGITGGTGAGVIIRNNIVVDNTVVGISASAGALIDFNNVNGNGTDYDGEAVPGANNLSVDPLFVDKDRRILHLQEGSPMIYAGEEQGGGPAVTIGAREVGYVSSNAATAWGGWIETATGNPIEVCPGPAGAGVCIDDGVEGTGHIILTPGVSSASVRSPVMGGSLRSVEFGALEDVTADSGDRDVIDADDGTYQRELRFRGSDTLFAANDALPNNWQVFFEGQVLVANHAYIQVSLTLTENGQ